MWAVWTGRDFLNGLNHVHAFDGGAKDTVTKALGSRCGEIQERVIAEVNKKLTRRRVRVWCAGHGYRAGHIGQPVARFVFDVIARGFLIHVGREAAALNHEAWYNPVENGVGEMAVFDVLHKVSAGFGRFFWVQLKLDVTVIGAQRYDHVGFPEVAARRVGVGLPAKFTRFLQPLQCPRELPRSFA